MKATPYIYILFLIWNYQYAFAQKKITLDIKGSNADSEFIISQIPYKKVFEHDSLLDFEIDLFRKKLTNKGFIHHTLENAYRNDSMYYAQFKLNSPIKKIRIRYTDMPILAKYMGIKTNDSNSIVIPFDYLTSFMKQVLVYYQNSGNPFVNAHLNNIEKEEKLIIADLIIEKKDKRNICTIIIKGYTDFPTSFLKHKLGFQKDEAFNRQKINKTSENLQAIPFVSEIRKPEVLFTPDSTALYLYLKRERSNHFDGLIGFSTSKGNNKLTFNGHIDLKIQNALNQGESLNINWLSNGNESQSLQLSLSAPYIFETPLTTIYDFDIYKKDSTFLSITNQIGVDYSIATNHKIGFVFENINSSKVNSSFDKNLIDFSSTYYGISYEFIKLNNHPIFNKKVYVKSKAIQGKRNKLTQSKLSNFISLLFNLSSKQNILIKNRSKILLSDDYYDNELYRIGGSTTIRGFEDGSLLAKSYSYLNVEYNYLTSSTSYFSILTDIGILMPPRMDSLLSTYSFGLGYSYKTPIGNLGIQYFIGNTSKNAFSFNNSKLHLRLSQNF